MPSNITSLYFLNWNIYFGQKTLIKGQIFETFECLGQNSSNSSCKFWNDKSISSSIFASFFIVMTHNSSINFKFIHFLLWIKISLQSSNSETFKCSGENFPYFSCHFPNCKSVFLHILPHSSVSWKITAPYFFRSNVIYFVEKKTIKVKTLRISSTHVKIYQILVIFETSNQNWLMVSNMTWRIWWIFTQPLKSLKISFRWALFVQSLQGLKFTEIKKSYLSWHWTVMKDLNELWSCGFENCMRNWVNFHQGTQKLKSCTLITSFCPKHIMLQVETCVMTLKDDAEFKGKQTRGLKHDIMNLVNFEASSWRSKNLLFHRLLLFKAYKVLDEKVQKSCVAWHWRVMQSLKKRWFLVPKMTWRIRRIFTRCTLMSFFWPKYIMFQLKYYRGVMCHEREGWCNI